MSIQLSDVLHPLSFEFAQQMAGAPSRALQRQHWARIHGESVALPPARLLAEHPLVASRRLQQDVDRHVDELTTFLTDHLSAPARFPELQFPGRRAPDVLSADLAITADPAAPGGWSLRWVEFQAFTSLVSSVHTWHQAACEIWPQARDLSPVVLPPGATDWLSAVRDWVAPAGGILLEHNARSQILNFDLQACARNFDLEMVEPAQLVRAGTTLAYRNSTGTHRDVAHVFNRLVMHELGDSAGFRETLAGADATWHSHPAWYYDISKALLPDMQQTPGNRSARAIAWRSLDLPAGALVAKNVKSHGGKAVLLNVDAPTLDALPFPEDWIVQPRYWPQALFSASDGSSVFGEIRCVIALRAGKAPWVASQFMRLSRGDKASAAGFDGSPGSGMCALYRPPEP